MRPPVNGSGPPPRPRKRSSVDLGTPPSSVPTTLFMASERDLEAVLDGSSSTGTGTDDTTFGVQSLDESQIREGSGDGRKSRDEEQEDGVVAGVLGGRRRSTLRRVVQIRREESLGNLSALSGMTSEASSPRKGKSPTRDQPELHLSRSSTPLSYASPFVGSEAPSSPKSLRSLRPSDEEYESASQAIGSSEDELERDETYPGLTSGGLRDLQLVMPSIAMPTRRPFTRRGKGLGHLKILLAGASGVGKTSMLKSLVQICEDIVHVDPLAPVAPTSPLNRREAKKKAPPSSIAPTTEIGEVHASTKAYPGWWSEIEGSQLLRRRSSTGEAVLERNICFVDTPGFGNSTSVLEHVQPVLRYLEGQMIKSVSTASMHDSELLGVLGGNGGSHVDVILYLISKELKPVDIEYIRLLSALTNVVLLHSKSDLASADSLVAMQGQLLYQLREHRICPFTFSSAPPKTLYHVCSLQSIDLETMDASLLMSSDYLNPLHPSELPLLVEHLFNPQNASFLKHSAAKKLLTWRKSSTPYSLALTPSPQRAILFPPTLGRSNTQASMSNGQALSLSSSTSIIRPSFTSARLADYAQREERLAQINLTKWASDVRRNIAEERSRFEKLANEEREAWLRQRLDECVFDGDSRRTAFVEKDHLRTHQANVRAQALRGWTGRRTDVMGQDPLGILKWRQRLLTTLQVMGGVGVGAFAMWLALSERWERGWDGGFDRHDVWGGFSQWIDGVMGAGIGWRLGAMVDGRR